jgi:hypothetical protein
VTGLRGSTEVAQVREGDEIFELAECRHDRTIERNYRVAQSSLALSLLVS